MPPTPPGYIFAIIFLICLIREDMGHDLAKFIAVLIVE
jgi:hypothetical protein